MDGESELLLSDVLGDWIDDLEELRHAPSATLRLAKREIGDDAKREARMPTQAGTRPRSPKVRAPTHSARDNQPSANVVSIAAHPVAQRRQFAVERGFGVDIECRKGGIIGFSFVGIRLSEENIDKVADDVQFVADCLRKDRSTFLGDEDT